MQVVILAGGIGSRLSPWTKSVPKPLLPMLDRTLLEQVIYTIPNNLIPWYTIDSCFFARAGDHTRKTRKRRAPRALAFPQKPRDRYRRLSAWPSSVSEAVHWTDRPFFPFSCFAQLVPPVSPPPIPRTSPASKQTGRT